MKGRRKQIVLGALGLVVVVVTFAVVLPRIASYTDVWAVVKQLDATWLLALGAAVVVNVITYAPPWMIALPGLRFRQALPFTQASTALTYVAPGGGIVGMAGSYGLLRMWGFGSSDVARAVTLTGIWNQLANLLLPVVAVLLLALDEESSASTDDRRRGRGRRVRGRRRAARARFLERRLCAKDRRRMSTRAQPGAPRAPPRRVGGVGQSASSIFAVPPSI